MSNNSNVTPYGVSSKKSKKNKLCRSIYAYKKKNNLPIIVEFTPRQLIPFLATIDVKYDTYIFDNNNQEQRYYWSQNLKQTFIRSMKNKGCIRKVNELNKLTIDTRLRHYPDQLNGEICSAFMQKIAQNSKKQLAGGLGKIIVPLDQVEVQDATRKMLLGISRSTNDTGNLKYIDILAQDMFRDGKILCIHGVHHVLRGQIYHKDYNDNKVPNPISVDGIEHKWVLDKSISSWTLSYVFDYSKHGEYVRITYVVGDGTIQVYMQEELPGYSLTFDEYDYYISHIVSTINISLMMEIPFELMDPVRFDLNQDVPVSFIHNYDPDLIKYLKYVTPTGEVNFPRYDFKGEYLKGSYYQIYLKKKLVNGKYEDFFRFEISVRSKVAATNILKDKSVFKAVTDNLIGNKYGGIANLNEVAKLHGKKFDAIWDDKSEVPIIPLTDGFADLKIGMDNRLDYMDKKYNQQVSNITHSTVVNSMIVHKLANEISDLGTNVKTYQDFSSGELQTILLKQVEIEEGLQAGFGVPEQFTEQISQGIISNQKTIEQFTEQIGKSMGELVGSNSLVTENLSQLQEDFLTTKEILDREVSNSVKTTEILSELKNNTYGKIGDHAVFKTEYLVENISEIAIDYRSAVQNIQFVTHKKKLVTKRVVNGIVLQEVIDLFIMDPHWKSLLQIRNSIKRKEAIVRNAIYLGLDADPSIFQSKIGKRKNSVIYNLYKGS